MNSFIHQKIPRNYWRRIEGLQNFPFATISFFLNQKLWFRNTIRSTWFTLENPPLEFLPMRSANARNLAKNRKADNQGYTQFLFENTKIMEIFAKYFIPETKSRNLWKKIWIFDPKFFRNIPLKNLPNRQVQGSNPSSLSYVLS